MLPSVPLNVDVMSLSIDGTEIMSMISAEMKSIMPYWKHIQELLSHPNVTSEAYEDLLSIKHAKNRLPEALEGISEAVRSGLQTPAEVIEMMREYPLIPINDETLSYVVDELACEVFPGVDTGIPAEWVLRSWQAKTLSQKKIS